MIGAVQRTGGAARRHSIELFSLCIRNIDKQSQGDGTASQEVTMEWCTDVIPYTGPGINEIGHTTSLSNRVILLTWAPWSSATSSVRSAGSYITEHQRKCFVPCDQRIHNNNMPAATESCSHKHCVYLQRRHGNKYTKKHACVTGKHTWANHTFRAQWLRLRHSCPTQPPK